MTDSSSSAALAELALAVQLPGFPGHRLDPKVAQLLREGLAGVCLFGSNTSAGQHTTARLTEAVHGVDPRALVAIDEEGGDVTRLHVEDGSPVLGAAALGAVDDLELTRYAGAMVGSELAAVGVDLALAPVADVNSNPRNPVIGSRSFGNDPTFVARHVLAWVEGVQSAGVAACVKHFPGHGDAGEDSHHTVPTVRADLATLQSRELSPFVAAVRGGAAAVMTAHLLVPALDAALPVTLSRRALSFLRADLGFEGVIVTDALDMAGVCRGRGIPEAAVLSLIAGADLLCLGDGKDVGLVREVQATIVTAVRSGRLPRARLAAAARACRGLRQQPRMAAARPALSAGVGLMVGADRALRIHGDLPCLTGARTVNLRTSPNVAIGEATWGVPDDLQLALDSGAGLDLALLPVRNVPIVVQVRDLHRHLDAQAAVRRLAAERQIVVIEWGWPAEPSADPPTICTYGMSLPTVLAVQKVLRGAGWGR